MLPYYWQSVGNEKDAVFVLGMLGECLEFSKHNYFVTCVSLRSLVPKSELCLECLAKIGAVEKKG
jgi:hypothetical protein